YHDALETGADVRDVPVGKRTHPFIPHVTQDSGLEAAEAEIEIAFELGRISIGVRQARRRQLDRAIVAGSSQPIDHGPTRISETEEFRHLVVGFSRRIVSR